MPTSAKEELNSTDGDLPPKYWLYDDPYPNIVGNQMNFYFLVYQPAVANSETVPALYHFLFLSVVFYNRLLKFQRGIGQSKIEPFKIGM